MALLTVIAFWEKLSFAGKKVVSVGKQLRRQYVNWVLHGNKQSDNDKIE